MSEEGRGTLVLGVVVCGDMYPDNIVSRCCEPPSRAARMTFMFRNDTGIPRLFMGSTGSEILRQRSWKLLDGVSTGAAGGDDAAWTLCLTWRSS